MPTVLAFVASFVCSLSLLFAVRSEISGQDSKTHVGWESTVNLWTWMHVDGVLDTKAGAVPGAMPATPPRTPACPAAAVYHRRDAAGRSAHRDHALHGDVHFVAGGDLLGRLHARRSGLLAVLHLYFAVRVFDDDAGFGQQFRAAVRVLGGGRRSAATCWSGSGTKSPRPWLPARRPSWSTGWGILASPSDCS